MHCRKNPFVISSFESTCHDFSLSHPSMFNSFFLGEKLNLNFLREMHISIQEVYLRIGKQKNA